MKTHDDTACYLGLLCRSFWLDNLEELAEPRHSGKITTRLSAAEAGCIVENPEDITWFFRLRHSDEELELLSSFMRILNSQ